MDNIDVQVDRVTQAQYKRWYEDLARRNLSHVRAGTVGQQYQYPDELGVWHIQTLLVTYPIVRDLLVGLGYYEFSFGADIGVGTVSFFDFFPVHNKTTLDLVYDYCRFIQYPAVNADAEYLPLPNSSMDFMIYSDILEHVLSFDSALSEARRVLCPGGVLVVVVPWEQEVRGSLSDFAHVRTFNQYNLQSRFSGFEILASKEIPTDEHGWLGQIAMVMQ